MTENPQRIQLSRRKGWRMPAGTVKVDRSTPWGNPFVVGVDGDAARSVELYTLMLRGYLCVSCKTDPEAQKAAKAHVSRNLSRLRGKDLACWCRLGKPCHADVLLTLANAPALSMKPESRARHQARELESTSR
jgi:hypothetical protein